MDAEVGRLSAYNFTAAQRFAVYMTHGEKCYLCGKPIDLMTMEVDHLIPETLIGKPELAEILRVIGRPATFELNSYENWLPACRQCNRTKSAIVFQVSPLVQALLQKAATKATDARHREKKTLTDKQLAAAVNAIQQAHETGVLDDAAKEVLGAVLHPAGDYREPEMIGTPLRVGPLYTILSEQNGIRVVQGRFGIGGRPSASNADSSFDCPNCGTGGAWSGARCVICGEMFED